MSLLLEWLRGFFVSTRHIAWHEDYRLVPRVPRHTALAGGSPRARAPDLTLRLARRTLAWALVTWAFQSLKFRRPGLSEGQDLWWDVWGPGGQTVSRGIDFGVLVLVGKEMRCGQQGYVSRAEFLRGREKPELSPAWLT